MKKNILILIFIFHVNLFIFTFTLKSQYRPDVEKVLKYTNQKQKGFSGRPTKYEIESSIKMVNQYILNSNKKEITNYLTNSDEDLRRKAREIVKKTSSYKKSFNDKVRKISATKKLSPDKLFKKNSLKVLDIAFDNRTKSEKRTSYAIIKKN